MIQRRIPDFWKKGPKSMGPQMPCHAEKPKTHPPNLRLTTRPAGSLPGVASARRSADALRARAACPTPGRPSGAADVGEGAEPAVWTEGTEGSGRSVLFGGSHGHASSLGTLSPDLWMDRNQRVPEPPEPRRRQIILESEVIGLFKCVALLYK